MPWHADLPATWDEARGHGTWNVCPLVFQPQMCVPNIAITRRYNAMCMLVGLPMAVLGVCKHQFEHGLKQNRASPVRSLPLVAWTTTTFNGAHMLTNSQSSVSQSVRESGSQSASQ
jgi:hypothetical protein